MSDQVDNLQSHIAALEATIKEQAEEIVEQKRVSQIQREVASQQRLTHNRLSVELDDLTNEMSAVCDASVAQKVDAIKLRDEIEQLNAELLESRKMAMTYGSLKQAQAISDKYDIPLGSRRERRPIATSIHDKGSKGG